MIPLSVPCLDGNEWRYVKECLDTGWVSSAGTYVERFEREFAAYVGAGSAVACVNGTSALQVALRLAGVGPGDEVLVPTVTFIAPVNTVRYLGAEPVFMDADEYYNIDVEKVRSFLDTHARTDGERTINIATGRRIAAIVPVHVFGNAVRIDALVDACAGRGIAVVEDATESLGTRYTEGPSRGRHAGTVGLLGCFSFNGNKIITTGGGGMIVTDDPELGRRAKYLTTQAKDDEVRFVHGDVGYNFRLTNIAAAIGVAQLESLPRFLENKRANHARLGAALAGVPGLAIPPLPPYADNNCWMYPLQVDPAAYGRDREQLMADLGRQGIQTRPLWHLNHLQAPYLGTESYRIERAHDLLASTLNLPCSVDLTADQLETVVRALRA